MSKSTNFKNTVEWFSNPKIAISLGIMVVIAGVVVWFFWDKIRDAIAEAKANNKLKDEVSQYGSGTLTNAQISSLAIQLYNAFRPSLTNWGTDEAAVERVLGQLGNNADYANLRVAYAAVNKDPKTDMDSRIAYEGTESEKRKWRGILQAKGITIYTF